MPWTDKKKRAAYDKKRSGTPEFIDYRKKQYVKHKSYYKIWASKNREKCRIAVKKWRKKNKEYCNRQTIKWYRDHPWARHHAAAKTRCTNPKSPKYSRYGGRGIKLNLTMNEAKILWLRDKADKMKFPSIDRKDNDGNYDFGNCQFLEMSAHSKKTNTLRRLKNARNYRRAGFIKRRAV